MEVNNKILFLCTMFLIIIFYGCSEEVSPSEQIDILSNKWSLSKITDIDGNLILVPQENLEYSIQFVNNDSTIVQSACNVGFGKYLVFEDKSLSISIGCTEAACLTPPPYLGYCDNLSNSTHYEIKENVLKIFFIDFYGNEKILIHNKN
ncbi:MAG: hypothetical protein ABIG69_12625 [Bacteroidota bacterium]